MDVLLVDGYNVIGASPELSRMKVIDLAQSRKSLIEMLIEYKAFSGYHVIVVFDALYVKGQESKIIQDGIEIIYTQEEETADECIERLIKDVKNIKNKVYVATSDYLEQRTIFSRGALRVSARELLMEIANIDTEIEQEVVKRKMNKPSSRIQMKEDVLKRFEEIRRGSTKND